jgi:uncharacterized protein YjfI (DUF2170 family)
MKGERGAKTSTEYQREYRERMRQLGLVKKDVWIRPEHAAVLAAMEKRLREAPAGTIGTPDETLPSPPRWTIRALHKALVDTPAVGEGAIDVEWMEGAEPTLHLTMREYGDLPVFVAVGGEQVIVEALLWPVSSVADPVAFNAHVLRTHKLLPLSTIGIEQIGDVPWYTIYGALDTRSSLPTICFEVETLAENVLAAVDAWRPFLTEAAAA